MPCALRTVYMFCRIRNTKLDLTVNNLFAKVAVLTYCLGAIAHIVVLVSGHPGDQMPIAIHWIVTLFAGYAGVGFILNIKRMSFKNFSDRFFYGLVLIHLITSAIIHAYSIIWSTNEWLTYFSNTYSYFAVVYFITFGYYSYRLDKRIRKM